MNDGGLDGPPLQKDKRRLPVGRGVFYFPVERLQWNENSKADDSAPDSSRNQVAALARARWTAVQVIGRRDMMVLLKMTGL
jgi:hypothetical protein